MRGEWREATPLLAVRSSVNWSLALSTHFSNTGKVAIPRWNFSCKKMMAPVHGGSKVGFLRLTSSVIWNWVILGAEAAVRLGEGGCYQHLWSLLAHPPEL